MFGSRPNEEHVKLNDSSPGMDAVYILKTWISYVFTG